MNNPKFADDVIRAMIELKRGFSDQIAKHIKAPHNEVMDMMKYLKSIYPNDFNSTSGIGDGIDISIKPLRIPYYENLLRNGGFQAIEGKRLADEQRDEEIKELTRKQLKDALKRSKRAEIISCISAMVAIGAILLEVGRSCNWWE